MKKDDAHPDREQLELYVMDELSAEDSAAIEAHVASCADCARELQHEARVELALSEVHRSGSARIDPDAIDSRPWVGRLRRTGTQGPARVVRRRRATRVLAAAAAIALIALGGGVVKRLESRAARSRPIIDPWAPPSEALVIAGPAASTDTALGGPSSDSILGENE
jgi:anti-sigma factor RsiW